ncbi:hypothetical protein Aph02nite_52780 [Actinoplanes philippinensis]|uniref:TIGR04222 domain-containing protein n=1 Tax=Actinoplanes philippinensis TaxID=35752 RepID=A0A1I2IIJ9_9ACTN|nr:hypothetical protein [Actinoplanes philippinensis]GIE79328.1 hypothetical protein Aph02nite_52780 [Actinoplanes philippinensis]SFF42024.1 hypothetical protein SAMN05421541_11081 [Actinoplanes philippinensis]
MSLGDYFEVLAWGTALVSAGIAVLWAARDRADRRTAAARVTAVEIDPYHAIARTGRTADMDRAAAAALLLDGRVQIDAEGLLSLPADGGPDVPPDHPVEVAVLDALSRREKPTALSALTERHSRFLAEQDTRAGVPEWLRSRWAHHNPSDHLQMAAATIALFLPFAWAAPMLWGEHPDGLFVGVFDYFFLSLFLGLTLLSIVVMTWPERRDHFRPHFTRVPPPPALTAMDETRTRRLRTSTFHTGASHHTAERR